MLLDGETESALTPEQTPKATRIEQWSLTLDQCKSLRGNPGGNFCFGLTA